MADQRYRISRAAKRALKARDEAIEGWLRREVAQTYDAMKADPGRGASIDDAFARVRAHHANRLKGQ